MPGPGVRKEDVLETLMEAHDSETSWKRDRAVPGRGTQRTCTHNWKGLGKLPSPELSGVRSMSSGSTSGCNVKFCRMEVRYMKSSMRARGSPRHSRRPAWVGGRAKSKGEVENGAALAHAQRESVGLKVTAGDITDKGLRVLGEMKPR